MNGSQLNMDFSAVGERNRFTEALHEGKFILSIEAPTPEYDSSDPAPAPEQIAALEEEVMRVQGMETVLALPDETLLLSGHSGPTTVAAERPNF